MGAIVPSTRRLPVYVRVHTPLWTVPMARGVLNAPGEEIGILIELKKLAWAWNIGLGRCHSEIRILAKCVTSLHFRSGKDCDFGVGCGLAEAKEEEVLGWILAGEDRPFITSTRLQSIFLCSSELIVGLCRAGCLRTMDFSWRRIPWRRGRKGSPVIARESVIEFLKHRKIA